MEYEITEKNNFLMVFKLPKEYPNEFCFGGGIPVEFTIVDWFCPIPNDENRALFIPMTMDNNDTDDFIESMQEFIATKNYHDRKSDYLVICNFGLTFIV